MFDPVNLGVAVTNTLLLGLLVVAMAVPCGTWLGVRLTRGNILGRSCAWLLLCSQIPIPLYVFAGSWKAGFGLQGWFTLPLSDADSLAAWMQSGPVKLVAVAFVHSVAAIPWVAITTAFGLRGRDLSLEGTALLEGGSRQIFWRTLMPRLIPWLLASSLLCLLPVFTEMVVTNLYQVRTLPELVYLDASRGTLRTTTYLAGIGLCLLPMLLLSITWFAIQGGWKQLMVCSAARNASHSMHDANVDSQQHQSFTRRVMQSLFVWIAIGGLTMLPVFNLAYKAGWTTTRSPDGAISYLWTANRFATTASESLTAFTEFFSWSFQLAILSTIFSIALAILMAWSSRKIPLLQWIWHGVCLTMLSTPGPLVGMFIIWTFNREATAFLYDRTLVPTALAQQFRLLPLAWLMCQLIIHSVPQSTWEMAKLDGASSWQKLTRVLLPQTWANWLALSGLLAMLSFGELSCSILVLPPGVATVSFRLFEMLHFGMRHQDSGLCGLLLCLGGVVALSFWKTLKDR